MATSIRPHELGVRGSACLKVQASPHPGVTAHLRHFAPARERQNRFFSRCPRGEVDGRVDHIFAGPILHGTHKGLHRWSRTISARSMNRSKNDCFRLNGGYARQSAFHLTGNLFSTCGSFYGDLQAVLFPSTSLLRADVEEPKCPT